MKLNINIFFKFAVAIFITTLLTNDNLFAQESFTYVEVLESEIEEEEEKDSYSSLSDQESDSIEDDGGKKQFRFIEQNEKSNNQITLARLTQFSSTKKRLSSHLPNYILYCSLVVYS